MKSALYGIEIPVCYLGKLIWMHLLTAYGKVHDNDHRDGDTERGGKMRRKREREIVLSKGPERVTIS